MAALASLIAKINAAGGASRTHAGTAPARPAGAPGRFPPIQAAIHLRALREVAAAAADQPLAAHP